jgi:hypothetical protein
MINKLIDLLKTDKDNWTPKWDVTRCTAHFVSYSHVSGIKVTSGVSGLEVLIDGDSISLSDEEYEKIHILYNEIADELSGMINEVRKKRKDEARERLIQRLIQRLESLED